MSKEPLTKEQHMLCSNNSVKEQYRSAKKLKTRISIHEKYSNNKHGFGKWII